MIEKVKRYFLPVTTAVFSLYISFLFAIGVILGYIGTNILFREIINKGKLPSTIKIGLGKKWQFHYHHWLMAATVLGIIGLFSAFAFWPKIFLGLGAGVIFHDLNKYGLADFYKVIGRKNV